MILWNEGRRLSVCPSVCRVSWPNSRTERSRKPKLSTTEANHTSNPWTHLEVKRSKVKVTSPINGVKTTQRYGDRRKFPWCKGESESVFHYISNAGRLHYNFLKIALFTMKLLYCQRTLTRAQCTAVKWLAELGPVIFGGRAFPFTPLDMPLGASVCTDAITCPWHKVGLMTRLHWRSQVLWLGILVSRLPVLTDFC